LRYIYLLVFLSVNLFLTSKACGQDYQKNIQDFLEHNFTNNQVGLVVQSLPDNKILYQQNAHKLFVPASLVKLFTLVSSLEELTPQFKNFEKQ